MTADSKPTAPIPLAAGFAAADDAQWRGLVDKVLKGADFRKRLVSRTADGIEIEPLYTRAGAVQDEQPGATPFTRGSAVRLAASGWRIAQMRAETTVEAWSALAAEDAAGGADTLVLRLAGPGQCGLPADAASIAAAIGDLPLDKVGIALEPGAQAFDAAAMLSAALDKRAASGALVRFGIDPLGILARTGMLSGLSPDGKRFTSPLPAKSPAAAVLSIDSCPYHEAGASEAQEIAALAATCVAYLRCLEASGVAPAASIPRIAVAMAADGHIFLTMAKLRAARRVLARVAQACGAAEAAGRMPLAVTTSQRMMARRDPWVNMLRVTAACASAAMAGADEICVLPHTWAIGQPDLFASRIARNTGLVLREEAWLGRIADPSGGAWAAERLTDELAQKAWAIFQEWESEGGMLAALTSGLVQEQIAAVAEARARDIATRRVEVTGVSAYPQLADDGVKVTPWPAAAPAGATIIRPLLPVRLAAPFEALRDAADRTASPPKVFLASLGGQAEHGARTMWITNLLAAGGIAAISGEGFTSSTEAGRAFAESGAAVACLCGADQTYAELGEATAMALKGAGAEYVWLAGRPREQQAALQAAGVDGFIYAGIDVVEVLATIQGQLDLT